MSAKRKTPKNRTKLFSFKYYLFRGPSKERLYKSFYLKTLDISQKRIVTYYATRNVDIGLYTIVFVNNVGMRRSKRKVRCWFGDYLVRHLVCIMSFSYYIAVCILRMCNCFARPPSAQTNNTMSHNMLVVGYTLGL